MTRAKVPYYLQKHQDLVSRALTAVEKGDHERAVALVAVAGEMRAMAELAFRVQQAISPAQIGSTRATEYWKIFADIK
ncbi:hypothetical protein GCM10009733_021320 [Nonomuraea maheshkhaliensis]|uniref:Uncharacterized protein n=2 Tax=Nonomuraea maheshkhaliensis TaxID=419590 RepID=A0ABN2F008_9ACTN